MNSVNNIHSEKSDVYNNHNHKNEHRYHKEQDAQNKNTDIFYVQMSI